jgi:hypothetical protein
VPLASPDCGSGPGAPSKLAGRVWPEIISRTCQRPFVACLHQRLPAAGFELTTLPHAWQVLFHNDTLTLSQRCRALRTTKQGCLDVRNYGRNQEKHRLCLKQDHLVCMPLCSPPVIACLLSICTSAGPRVHKLQACSCCEEPALGTHRHHPGHPLKRPLLHDVQDARSGHQSQSLYLMCAIPCRHVHRPKYHQRAMEAAITKDTMKGAEISAV